MNDLKGFINEYGQVKTPEEWKMNAKKIPFENEMINDNSQLYNRYKMILKVSVISILVLLLSIGSIHVAAANIPSFRSFLENIFSNNNRSVSVIPQDQLPEIGSYEVQNSFLITNLDSSMQKIFALQNGKLNEVTPKTCEGYTLYDGKKITYSFQYAMNGDDVYGFAFEGAARELTSYPGAVNSAILTLSINEKFDDSWYVDLISGELSPLVNRDRADEIYQMKAIHSMLTVDGVDSWEARKTYAVDIKASPNGDYILFQSNRDDLVTSPLTKTSEITENSKHRHWFLHNTKTKEEIRLDFIDWFLATGYIFWIDMENIAVLNYDDTNECWRPILYNTTTKEQTVLGPVKGGDHKYTLIFDEPTEDGLTIYDYLHNNTVQFTLEETDSFITYFSNTNLQFFRKDGSILLYDLKTREKIVIDQVKSFMNKEYGDEESVYSIFELDNKTLLLISELDMDHHRFYLVTQD